MSAHYLYYSKDIPPLLDPLRYNRTTPRGCIASTWRVRSHLQLVFDQRRKQGQTTAVNKLTSTVAYVRDTFVEGFNAFAGRSQAATLYA